MSVDLAVTYTITAPSSVDGRGEIAVLNDAASGNFVGWLKDFTGLASPTVRENTDNLVERHGASHGRFYFGPRPFTMEILVARASTWTASHSRLDKLLRATNAMESDGTVVWTETGGVAKRLTFRRQLVSFDNEGAKCLFGGVCADARILADTESSASPGSGLSNAGNVGTLPRFTFTSGASGTVALSRTSPSPTETLTLTIGGASGLAASTSTTVDFAARTVVQGSTNKYSAVQIPATWWEMAPGSNTISVTGATSVTVLWRSAWL